MTGEEEGFEQRLLLPKGDYSIVGTSSVEEKMLEVTSRKQKSISEASFIESVANLGSGHGGVRSDFFARHALFGSSAILGMKFGSELVVRQTC